MSIMYDRFVCFIQGLGLSFCMFTQSFIIVCWFIVEVSDHARVIKEMHRSAQGGNNKRPYYHGNFCGSRSSSHFSRSGSQGRYPLY